MGSLDAAIHHFPAHPLPTPAGSTLKKIGPGILSHEVHVILSRLPAIDPHDVIERGDLLELVLVHPYLEELTVCRIIGYPCPNAHGLLRDAVLGFGAPFEGQHIHPKLSIVGGPNRFGPIYAIAQLAIDPVKGMVGFNALNK